MYKGRKPTAIAPGSARFTSSSLLATSASLIEHVFAIKATTNEVIDYEGDRTEESFYRFIAEHGTHKIDVTKDSVVEEDLKKVEEDVKKEAQDKHDEL